MISTNYGNQQLYKIQDTDPLFGFIASLAVGGGLLGGGLALKSSYEGKDASRTVQNFPATISKITKYNVTYEGNAESINKRARSDTDYNVAAEDIKKINDYHTFYVKKVVGKSATTKESLKIVDVEKKVSQIEVRIVQNGVTSTAVINQSNFTREILESEVGKDINIEFDPNDMTNISMAVEGMTWSQSAGCWTMISFGILFILVSLYILYTIMAPKLFPKKN
jgi:cobalamin biosynthesis Mg chelatase CobN